MKIIIYVLCYNEHTYQHALKIFTQDYFKIIIIPTTLYLENIMYNNWLLEHIDEWENCEYVGTISWKAFEKINRSIFDNLLDCLMKNKPDIISFYGSSNNNTILDTDKYHPHFSSILKILMYNLNIDSSIYFDPNMIIFYSNYWITTPKWMKKYIDFFKKAQYILDTNEDIQEKLWSDSLYNGKLSKDECLNIFKKPYYTYHCFLCERLPSIYFWYKKGRILSFV